MTRTACLLVSLAVAGCATDARSLQTQQAHQLTVTFNADGRTASVAATVTRAGARDVITMRDVDVLRNDATGELLVSGITDRGSVLVKVHRDGLTVSWGRTVDD